MPSALLTPARKDALLALAAIALLAGPLWVQALHVGDPTHRYERIRVEIDGERGIQYAGNSDAPRSLLISEELGCSIARETRTCAFERYLAENHTVPTTVHTTSPNLTSSYLGVERYRYVLLDGKTYETVYVPNRSVRNSDGLYRRDLALRPVPVGETLQSVSLNATAQRAAIPPAALEAARTGEGTARREVEVPETPIRLDDGAYYRVYHASRTEALPVEHLAGGFLTYVAPILGLHTLITISRRVEVRYVGGGRN